MTQHHQGEEVRRQAQAAAGEAQEAAGQTAQQAKESASAAVEQGKRKTAEYTKQAKDRGMHMLDEQKHNAASQLHTLGEAARRAAGKFRDDHDDNIAGYIDAVADEADRFAGYLEKRDVNSLVHDVQDLARRRPELFLGGMFVAGLALTRFLKASGRHDSGREHAYRQQPRPAPIHYDAGTRGATFDEARNVPGGSFEDLDALPADVVSEQPQGTQRPGTEV